MARALSTVTRGFRRAAAGRSGAAACVVARPVAGASAGGRALPAGGPLARGLSCGRAVGRRGRARVLHGRGSTGPSRGRQGAGRAGHRGWAASRGLLLRPRPGRNRRAARSDSAPSRWLSRPLAGWRVSAHAAVRLFAGVCRGARAARGVVGFVRAAGRPARTA